MAKIPNCKSYDEGQCTAGTKCQSCWTITDYLDWDAKRLMTIPKGIRFAVVKRQAEQIKSRQGEA